MKLAIEALREISKAAPHHEPNEDNMGGNKDDVAYELSERASSLLGDMARIALSHIEEQRPTQDESLRQRSVFEQAARPLMKLLSEEYHPHHTVVVTANRAELSEGCVSVRVDDYLKD